MITHGGSPQPEQYNLLAVTASSVSLQIEEVFFLREPNKSQKQKRAPRGALSV
jgi:hypothetical protein